MGNILKNTPSNHLKLSIQGYNSEIKELERYISRLRDRIVLINNELESRGEEKVINENSGLNIADVT